MKAKATNAVIFTPEDRLAQLLERQSFKSQPAPSEQESQGAHRVVTTLENPVKTLKISMRTLGNWKAEGEIPIRRKAIGLRVLVVG